MRRGDFAAAWRISDRVLAERCARGEDCRRWPRHMQLIWDGSELDGRRVLVRCYHGLGDTLQFARLLEPLRRRAREVTLWAQTPLLGVLRHVRGIDRLLPLHDGVPGAAYDTDLEIMELAHALRITPQDLPGRMPYIELMLEPPLRAARNLLHVGIAWRSGDWAPARSIPTRALQPLAQVPGIVLYSLQYPPEPLSFPAHAIACRDILRLARRMAMLDLVISVDTMVAHLAGALGLPTWLLLHSFPDWRWMESGDRTPWYPSMRLFRSNEPHWRTLLRRVCAALSAERARLNATRRTRSIDCRASSD